MKPKVGWKKFYADIMKYYGTGYGAILGRFSGIINLALLGSTYLLVKGLNYLSCNLLLLVLGF